MLSSSFTLSSPHILLHRSEKQLHTLFRNTLFRNTPLPEYTPSEHPLPNTSSGTPLSEHLFRNTPLPEHPPSGTPPFRNTPLPEHPSSGTPLFRNTPLPESGLFCIQCSPVLFIFLHRT
ncbi:hypothetical protein STEG23_020076 [Scotinomys teguina]